MRPVLIGLVRGYRRWLSGRGPLRRVRCTFHGGETCGAFGLRAAHEAPSTWRALGRIRRRLRRCRDASVFALDGGAALGWGRDHDRPVAALIADLRADGEGPAAIATVLAARAMVAAWRGDAAELAEVTAARRGLPRAAVMLRPAPVRRRRWRRAAVIAVALAVVAVVAPLAAVGLGVGLGALAFRARRGAFDLRRRLSHQTRAASLRGAVPTLAPGLESRYETA